MSHGAGETYELFAVRYATRIGQRVENFIGGDPHEGPMPMDYFVWVARNADRTVLIDTGCTREVAERRGRTFLRCPIDTLGALGVDVDQIDDVILSHLHYDHVGNLPRLSHARFHVQEREMAYAAGPHMRHRFLSQAFEADDVADLVRLNFASRVVFHAGDAQCLPGIEVHLAGGHSHGLQFVRVHTARGWVVLASDVAHYYENIVSRRPFSIAYNVGEMLDGFELLLRHGGDLGCIVPGHDPLVTQLFPPLAAEFDGIIHRLDVAPDAAALARISNAAG